VCVGGQEALALQAATRSIPIVFMQVGDPIEQGLVASFARPGGNTTGFTQMTDELDSKRLELLRAIVPSLSRAAILTDSRLTLRARLEKRFANAEATAKLLGIALQRVDATTPAELTDAFGGDRGVGQRGLADPKGPAIRY
jgi:putative tryptophan/tyrosine transport system substrate-binding protein